MIKLNMNKEIEIKRDSKVNVFYYISSQHIRIRYTINWRVQVTHTACAFVTSL